MRREFNVGDIIYIPIMSGSFSEGKILDIDDNVLDPRMTYKVEFDEFNIITFFDEETICNWMDIYRNNLGRDCNSHHEL